MASILGFTSVANAEAPPKGFRYSLDAGTIGLLGDLNSQGTRFGAGFGVAYQMADPWSFDIDYIGASFEDVDHRAFDVGASWFLADFENQSHLSAGFSFLHNDIKLLSRSGDAAGIYLGGGMYFPLADRLSAGFDVRYRKAFQTKATIAGAEVTTVSDTYSLMLKLIYAPDLSD